MAIVAVRDPTTLGTQKAPMTDPRNESRCAHGQPSAAAAAISELRESGEHLAYAGSIAAEAARERLHQLKESAGQRVEQGREKIKGWEETLQGHVSEHPCARS
jgi:hypothetical protein